MQYRPVFAALLLFTSLSNNTFAQSKGPIAPIPNVTIKKSMVMASLGDSITAGAFADTAATLPTSFFPGLFNLLNLTEVFRQKAIETLVENKELWSWASGVGVSSHFMRLKKYLKSTTGSNDLQVVNMAVSGSVASDVVEQARHFATAMMESPSTEIKYVTILIGANDTCDGVSPEETASSMEKAFDVLASIPQKKPVRILVSSVPQIDQLGENKIKKHITGNFLLSCEVVRSKLLKFCNNITHWSNDSEHEANAMKVQQTNLLLESSVNAARLKHANLDIQFSNALSQEDLKFNVLASDCFHPNIAGHQQIAEKLWNDQPWFK